MKKSKMRSEASTSSNNSNRRGETIVADCGTCRSSCGYCKSSGRTSITHDLLDRGWRRSGSFLYKPDMERTCCPSYTIRLKASDFVPSKEQRRVSRRMQRFLDGTLDVGKKSVEIIEDPITSNCHKVSNSEENNSLSHNNKEKIKEEEILRYLSGKIDNAVQSCIVRGEFPSGIQLPKASVKKVSQAKGKLLVEEMENLLYSSNIAFQIAATLKRAQLAEKDVQQIRVSGQRAEEKGTSPKIIAEKLASSIIQLAETSGLSIRACNGHLNFYSAVKLASSDEDVQIATISDESAKGCDSKSSCLKNSSEKPQQKRHKLRIRLKRSSFDPQEFELCRRYQINVHNDKPDRVT